MDVRQDAAHSWPPQAAGDLLATCCHHYTPLRTTACPRPTRLRRHRRTRGKKPRSEAALPAAQSPARRGELAPGDPRRQRAGPGWRLCRCHPALRQMRPAPTPSTPDPRDSSTKGPSSAPGAEPGVRLALRSVSSATRTPSPAAQGSGERGWREEAQPSRAGGTGLAPTRLPSASSPAAPCPGRAPGSGARSPGRGARSPARCRSPPAPRGRAPARSVTLLRAGAPPQVPAGAAQGQGAAGDRQS